MDTTTPQLANSTTPLTIPTTVGQSVYQPQNGGTLTKISDFTTPSIPSTINATDLTQTAHSVPTVNPDNSNSLVTGIQSTTNPQALSGSIAAGTGIGGQSIQQLQTSASGAQQEQDQTSGEISKLLTELGYKSQDIASAQQQAGLPALTQQITDLNTTLAQKTAAYNNQFQQIGGQNIPSTFVSGQLALARQAAAVDIAGTSAQLQAAQGNLHTAQDTINNAINLKYGALTDQLNAKEKYFQDNKENFTAKQKLVSDRQTQIIDAQKTQILNDHNVALQAQKDLSNYVSKTGSDAASGYKAMSDYLNNKISIGDFYKVIGSNTDGLNPVVQSTMNMIGVENDMPVSAAIQSVGLNAIINGIVQQEGGTPQGTNNPGNIKFAGQVGATKGKSATDGGNFANFATPQDFQNAIGAMINKAAVKGSNLSDFIASYKGVTTNAGNAVPGTTGSQTIDATTPGYSSAKVPNAGGLTQSALDQAAIDYATTNKMPTLTGISKFMTGQQKTAVQNRAAELNAGGNIAGNAAQLKSLSSSMGTQQKYYDTINRAYNTATDNLGVLNKLMTQYGINQSNVPLINQLENKVRAGITDAGTIAAFNANLAGLRAEYAQVLSKGGQVTEGTRSEANTLIPDDLSPAQLQQVATTLSSEGANAVKEAKNQVDTLQGQINGIIQPATPVSTLPTGITQGATITYGGKQYTVDAQGNMTPIS